MVALIGARRIAIERVGTDCYGRTLARIEAGGIDAGTRLVEEGLAERYRGPVTPCG